MPFGASLKWVSARVSFFWSSNNASSPAENDPRQTWTGFLQHNRVRSRTMVSILDAFLKCYFPKILRVLFWQNLQSIMYLMFSVVKGSLLGYCHISINDPSSLSIGQYSLTTDEICQRFPKPHYPTLFIVFNSIFWNGISVLLKKNKVNPTLYIIDIFSVANDSSLWPCFTFSIVLFSILCKPDFPVYLVRLGIYCLFTGIFSERNLLFFHVYTWPDVRLVLWSFNEPLDC